MCEHPDVTVEDKELTSTLSPVCTSEPENANADTPDADPLAKLAAQLASLSPAARPRQYAASQGNEGNDDLAWWWNEAARSWKVAVHVAPLADPHNKHHQHGVLNLIDDAIVADTNPV